jgi:hypothetical protein
VHLEGLGKVKKSTSSGTRTGELPACGTVPQPTTLGDNVLLPISGKKRNQNKKTA